jgi:hypothetical protein
LGEKHTRYTKRTQNRLNHTFTVERVDFAKYTAMKRGHELKPEKVENAEKNIIKKEEPVVELDETESETSDDEPGPKYNLADM